MARPFIALELHPALKGPLEELVRGLNKGDLAGRWARLDTAHITLVFLGETPESEVDRVAGVVHRVAAGHARLTLEVCGSGTFGSPRAPRVLWLGVGGDLAKAQALRAELMAATHDAGEPQDPRPWMPHVTLARSRSPRGAPGLRELSDRLGAVRFPPEVFEEVTLFRTIGGRHQALTRAPLQEMRGNLQP